MSSASAAITERHFAYIAAHSAGDDAFLRELKAAARAAGIREIWIAPEQASFIAVLLGLIDAREVVEVGTLAGYAAIAMARALRPGGRVRTIELVPAHAAFARAWVERSDVRDRVEVIEADARAILPALPAASVDACFIDADKESYDFYVAECVRALRPGGLLMLDNAFAFGDLFRAPQQDPEVGAIRRVNDALAARGDLRGIIVPFGDGMWVAVKRER
jgi:O-methyltransferase